MNNPATLETFTMTTRSDIYFKKKRLDEILARIDKLQARWRNIKQAGGSLKAVKDIESQLAKLDSEKFTAIKQVDKSMMEWQASLQAEIALKSKEERAAFIDELRLQRLKEQQGKASTEGTRILLAMGDETRQQYLEAWNEFEAMPETRRNEWACARVGISKQRGNEIRRQLGIGAKRKRI